jgi:4-diphosphocytidyl-2-C-methyl-D-erythritol kinase
LIVHAPAKINLALHITGQRHDCYHVLESLIIFAQAGDVLTFTAAREDRLLFSGPFGAAFSGDASTNLVARARDALRHIAGDQPCPPVAITLAKNLPVASGIGGGSADAAATLKGLNSFWQLGFSLTELTRIGLTLGADVPMCVYGVPLIATGIGEVIEPATGLPELPMLLVNPGVAVSTPAIFKTLLLKNNPPLPSLPAFGSVHDFVIWLHTTRNDLEAPAVALCPEIQRVLTSLLTSGALFARMSGSGATCFGIYESQVTADKAKQTIAEAHGEWWIA